MRVIESRRGGAGETGARRRLACPRGLALLACAVLLHAAGAVQAQGTREDYARAESFLPKNVEELVFRAEVSPNWIQEEDRFWYRVSVPGGKEFVLVDIPRDERRPAFDHARLAAGLERSLQREVSARDLPFDRFEYTAAGDAIELEADSKRLRCDLVRYDCVTIPTPEPRGRALSPDGRWLAFVRDHDLYVRYLESGWEVRLTNDGRRDYGYATPNPSPLLMIEQRTSEPQQPAAVFWSPDSKRLLTYRMDSRRAGRLTMVQHAPSDRVRPHSYSYVYPQAQDSVLPVAEPVIFEAGSWRRIPVQTTALPMQYFGGPRFSWTEDGERAFAVVADRGYTRREVRKIDPATGEVRVLINEEGNPFVDTSSGYMLELLDGGPRALWGSERDGWMHLYLMDTGTGEVVRQLTRGEWVVRGIEHVDEEAGVVYFTASGRERGRDPYLVHLYRVGLDGSGLRLLTPEPAEHSVSLSPSGRHFIDTYSRADLAPVSVLRRASDGRVVRELERADVQNLLQTGWNWPEPFQAKARDGSTDIYGVIWRPSTFDPTKSYPVVEQIYTGPHGFHVPKSFHRAYRNAAQSMAELGFVVVMVDGLGTARRGREFQKHSYRNLADSGLEDHIAALRQLAARYPYLDLTRVGVYGHSAGGYNSARAMFAHPEFYKVAVSSAGSHDSQMDKAWWNTQWMGYPVGPHYLEQSNSALAHRLEGKLLLAHGDTDENVPVSATLQLADALIEANKDFDLLILPNQTHSLGRHPYFIRRRWDYFVRHLLGVEPPEDFRIVEDSTR